MLDFSPWTRVRIAVLAVGALVLWVRYQMRSVQFVNQNHLEYFEDSSTGVGTRYRVLVPSSYTGGAYATIEALVRPTAPGFYAKFPGSTPFHAHTSQEEKLEVKEGAMGYNLHGEIKTAVAGDVVVVPKGIPHVIWVNDTSQPLLFTATLTPAAPQGEHFFECLAGLGASYGSVTAIHPLQMAVLLTDAGVEMHGVPPGMTWAFKNMLAPVAKYLFGFQSSFVGFVTSRQHIGGQQQQQQEEGLGRQEGVPSERSEL